MKRSSGHRVLRLVGAAAIAAVTLAVFSTSAGAQTPGCIVDSASGLPLAQAAPGLCVVRSDTHTHLLQTSEQGLLVVSTEKRPDDIGRSNHDGTIPLNLHDRDAALIFCPTGTLDLVTGAPTSECLWDLESMTPGRAALTGSGRVFASTALDESGSARCPTTVTVVASATSPGGDDFDLTSSLVLSLTGLSFDEGAAAKLHCVASTQGVTLSYRYGSTAAARPFINLAKNLDIRHPEGTAGSLSVELEWLNELSDEDWHLVADLVRLEEADWRLLHQLMSLDENQLQALDAEFAVADAAVITKDGRVLPTSELTHGDSGTVVTKGEIDGILDNILSRVNLIYSRVNSMLPVVNGISGRIPNRADVRSLIGNFTDIQQFAAVVQRVREIIGGVLAIAATLREGFDVWYGSSCDTSSQCAQFKADLAGFFADIREGVEFIQATSCLDHPGLEIRPLDTSLVEELVIDRAPAVVLYSLYKILDRMAPSGSGDGWPTLVSSVLDEIPADFRSGLIGLCQPGAKSSPIGSGGPVCRLLRPEATGAFLTAAKTIAIRKEKIAKRIDSFFKDDVVAQGGAVAGGGGSAGTNAKNPAKVVSQWLKDASDDLPDTVRDIIDKRNQCLEADETIEGDLRDCQPPVSVFLTNLGPLTPHPTFKDVEFVVSQRIKQIERCQQSGGCTDFDVARAGEYLTDAQHKRGRVWGYEFLCCAYQELNGGTELVCPPPHPG